MLRAGLPPLSLIAQVDGLGLRMSGVSGEHHGSWTARAQEYRRLASLTAMEMVKEELFRLASACEAKAISKPAVDAPGN